MNVHYSELNSNIFFPIDEEGFLRPKLKGLKDIVEINRNVILKVISECSFYMGNNLNSIFFRGSQLLVSSYSDFDLVLICDSKDEERVDKISTYLNSKLLQEFKHIKYFDVAIFSLSEIYNSRKLQFVIKVLSIRVYGKPVDEQFERFSISKEIIFLLPELDEKWLKIKTIIQFNDSQDWTIVANYIIKFFIRCSYELVLEKENKYTRDLFFCYRIFSKYYPEHEQKCRNILQYYDKNQIDKQLFISEMQEYFVLLKSSKDKGYARK